MFKKLLLMLQLLQVVFGAPVFDMPGVMMAKVRRQTAGDIDWKITEFSECSASCGGGLRIRSVRCQNDDDIISEDCSIGSKPKSYEFCNQINCTTNNPNSDLLPESATYTFKSDGNDSSVAVLQFDNQGPNSYTVTLNITEADTTVTSINVIVVPDGTQTRITVYGASTVVGIGKLLPDDDISLLVGEEDLLNLNSPVKISVKSTQSIEYQDDRVIIVGGDSTVDNIGTLYYYDGLKVYKLNGAIINPLEGPGNLYYNPGRGTAVYSINGDLNTQLDTVIASLSMTTDFNPEVPFVPSTTSSRGPDFITTTEYDVSLPPTQFPQTDKPVTTDEEVVIPDETDDSDDESDDSDDESDNSDDESDGFDDESDDSDDESDDSDDESSMDSSKDDGDDKSTEDESSVDISNEDESEESTTEDSSSCSKSHSHSHHHDHSHSHHHDHSHSHHRSHSHHHHRHPHHCHAHPHHHHSHPHRSEKDETKSPQNKSF